MELVTLAVDDVLSYVVVCISNHVLLLHVRGKPRSHLSIHLRPLSLDRRQPLGVSSCSYRAKSRRRGRTSMCMTGSAPTVAILPSIQLLQMRAEVFRC
jgi:hypothetical protein